MHVSLIDAGRTETRITLLERNGHVWHGYLPDVSPGQRDGLRFNPNKLLVDPYARLIEGELTLDPAIFGYDRDPVGPRRDGRDSAPFVPRCVVTGDAFPWGDDRLPRVPWAETVLYEMHVRGFTELHPDVPPELRVTFAGLSQPAAREHLIRRGVTSVELLPVHAFVCERHLL